MAIDALIFVESKTLKQAHNLATQWLQQHRYRTNSAVENLQPWPQEE